ncbi:unnamed protein product, partial [Musa textilis]
WGDIKAHLESSGLEPIVSGVVPLLPSGRILSCNPVLVLSGSLTSSSCVWFRCALY